uniref:Deoxyribonuclease-1 n=1 Tax=Candidatus Kentrum sp. LFY TaxID=2126342 RepID=A0A450WDB5_9GAMM|nr:MAG: deoxyribonuclease-1 [Candidatus Kentron sp. LFY]
MLCRTIFQVAALLAGLVLMGCDGLQEFTSSGDQDATPGEMAQIDWEPVRETALDRSAALNFRAAKKSLYPLYEKAGVTRTFYCDCPYTGKKPDLATCGVTPRRNPKRASRLEAEHIMPISLLGRTLGCWADGGRKNCRKTDSFFKRAEADLHNLTPAIGEINGDRSNYPPIEDIPGEKREYGTCDVEIAGKRFEPPPHRRGDIARAYLYMMKVYGAPLTDREIGMFGRWSREDPPTEDERRIHALKAKAQGNRNPYYDFR